MYYLGIDKESVMFDYEDYYRFIAKQVPDKCRICEVGVANAKSAIALAEFILEQGKTIERFVLVDNLDYGKQKQLQTIMTHLSKSGVAQFAEFYPMSSLDASCEFPDGYFHFVFLDSSHTYEQTKAEIRLWVRKVMDDGILAGHDASMADVEQAVNEVLPRFYQDGEDLKHCLKVVPTALEHNIWEFNKNWRTIKEVK